MVSIQNCEWLHLSLVSRPSALPPLDDGREAGARSKDVALSLLILILRFQPFKTIYWNYEGGAATETLELGGPLRG